MTHDPTQQALETFPGARVTKSTLAPDSGIEQVPEHAVEEAMLEAFRQMWLTADAQQNLVQSHNVVWTQMQLVKERLEEAARFLKDHMT